MSKRDTALADLETELPAEYRLVPRSAEDGEELEPIGSGGSSVVYRATYRGRLHRALKVMVPRDDLRDSLDLERFRESYENEVEQLANLSHESLAKITDFGSLQLAGETYPYIATEYIDGVDFLKFARTDTVTGDQILAALRQVLGAISYMHTQGVMHCDLKPDNILVRTVDTMDGPRHQAIVVDLGAARLVDGEDQQELLYFYSTPRFVHRDLRLVLSNRTGNRIKRSDLRRYFPNQDLHSLSVIISDLLEDDGVNQKIRSGPGPRVVHALRFLASAVRDVPDDQNVLSAFDFDQRLGRADDSVFNLLDVAELRAVPGPGIVIPSTGSRVALSQRANSVVAHPSFQRLRRLPQLDLLDSILPGATHTRFVHALHTYDIFRRSLMFLLADWRFRLEVSKDEIEQALVFALVSQLGHFHFLHMFEDFLTGGFATDPHIASAKLAGDQELLSRAMLGADGGFPIVRNAKGASMGDLIADWGHDWSSINALMRNPASPVQGVLAALMDSPIDSEKLSYLADDSRATGVPFGGAVSGEPIFAALVVPSREEWDSRPRKALLGVRERSLAYLESGVLARYWNIQTAYWNRTNRAIQAMIKFQIQTLIVSGTFDFEQYLSATLHLSSDGALRWLNAQFESGQQRGKIPSNTVNPIAPLLESERAIYKRLVTIPGVSSVLGRDRDHQVFDNIRGMSLATEQQVIDAVAAELASVVPGLVVNVGDILLDLPRPAREASSGEVLLYTDDRNEYMGELFGVSQLLKNRNEAFEGNVKRLRIFVSPRLYAALHDEGKLNVAYDACLGMLRTRWSS